MFNLPYYQLYDYYMLRVPSSYVRVFHASPNSPGVDVYANEKLVAKDLKYKMFSPYLKVPSGEYNIKVYRAGTVRRPLIDTKVSLTPNTIYTVAAINKLESIQLFPIVDSKTAIKPGKTNIRFIHLSPDAPAVDISLRDGKILFSNVSYKGVTNYTTVDPGKYTLLVKAVGTNEVVLTVPSITLRPGLNLSIYAVGLAGGKPDLQLLIPLDGSTYL